MSCFVVLFTAVDLPRCLPMFCENTTIAAPPSFPLRSTVFDFEMSQETKYSRIPVYSGEIDRISGVVLSKDLLDFVQVK